MGTPMSCNRTFRPRVSAALFLALLLGSAVVGLTRAQESGFNCGREHVERRTEPGAIWYELYELRREVASALRRNGNDELTGRFEQCALEALQKSAMFGNREAQFRYGLHLATSNPSNPDRVAEAREWWRKAAAQGHRGAQALLKTQR
ncbi:MAG TPA: hypothetical protein VIF14_14330 [Alphaproteobacteria bacterium]|jgi:TPR repeat protein